MKIRSIVFYIVRAGINDSIFYFTGFGPAKVYGKMEALFTKNKHEAIYYLDQTGHNDATGDLMIIEAYNGKSHRCSIQSGYADIEFNWRDCPSPASSAKASDQPAEKIESELSEAWLVVCTFNGIRTCQFFESELEADSVSPTRAHYEGVSMTKEKIYIRRA